MLRFMMITWCVLTVQCAENTIIMGDITDEMKTLIARSKVPLNIDNPVFVTFGSFSVLLPCIPTSDVAKVHVTQFQWRVLKNMTIHTTKYVSTSINMITRELAINGRTGTVGSLFYTGARYYCVIDTPYGQTVVYTYNVIVVQVPVFVLQMRVLLGNMPCDEKLQRDLAASTAATFNSQACEGMVKQRHGWTDDDLSSNAEAVQQDKEELCRTTTFVLDHARGQTQTTQCDPSYIMFQRLPKTYKTPFSCKSLKCFHDSALATFDDDPLAEYLKKNYSSTAGSYVDTGGSYDQTLVATCEKGFRAFQYEACLPCSPGTYGMQRPDLTWECVPCGPNAVAGRFGTNHVCTLCVDGTLANEDHTVCIADEQGDEAMQCLYTQSLN